MASHWLHYWKAPQVRRGLADGVLAHIASGQFHRVADGDRIWIVNVSESGELFTIGFVDASTPISMEEARRRLDYEPWDAEYHILVDPATAQRARFVSLGEIVADLRFQGTARDRLQLTNGRVNGQQLQTMRRLTELSATQVQAAWDKGLDDQASEYARLEAEIVSLGDLDVKREVLVRTEQRFLRQHLFGAEGVGTCCLCGIEYPTEFLIAAHVKRRADCTDQERRDFANNVVPMCVFGCDALFERGYVVVEQGTIRARAPGKLTAVVREYLHSLAGHHCDMWHPGSAPYFDWHATATKGEP